MRIENTAGWVDVGAKVDPTRWSRWDEIGERQVAIGAGQYAPTISRSEARQVALALALGPEGTGKAPGTATVDNGRGHLLADGTSSRAPGIVTVWDAAGEMLAQYRTLGNGKRLHDRAADQRALKAGPAERGRKATPEALEARRARGATPEARARDAARKAASRGEAKAAALLADGGAMRA